MKYIILTFLTLFCAFKAKAQEYKMAGPYEVVARDGQYSGSKGGSERDMKAAFHFAQQGKSTEAVAIINAYATTLQRLDGHDAPLCCIQGYDLACAMSMMKAYKTPEWDMMLRRVFLPTIRQFDAASPYANGNWGAIVNRMRMAMAIAMEDTVLYKEAVDYFYHANDNGALPRYVDAKGQCQETGRDQAHAQLGLEALCQTCEMAWQQGDDLWGALDNRLMKGIEYTAKYNLGYDVPFTQWTDCTGLYNDWTEPGAMSRGKLWDIYELPYLHYVGRKHLKMPYAKKALDVRRRQKAKPGETCLVNGVTEGSKLHQVFTYAAPQGAPLKHDYDVYILPRDKKEWIKIDTYMARVNAPVGNNKHRVSEISYAFFDFTGDVFVRVICKNKKYKTARIRPDYKGTIANIQNDSVLQFLLFQPENVSVEFDGSITDNLLLFTSKPTLSRHEAEAQAKLDGREFRYYAPGYYADEDTIRVPSNTTIYLEGGAYLTSTFAIDDAQNVSILGRGIARPGSGYEGCHVYRSHNVLIDGMMVNTCPIGESSNVTLHDVRSISHPSWGDGLNVFGGCRDILFDRVFCRNSDDCTTVYATRKGFKGSVSGVKMRNSTLWADLAHPIFIGLHGAGNLVEKGVEADSVTDLKYENIDILCQSEPQVDYQGCLAINCGDNNLVRRVLFDNIRIENIHQGSLFHVKVTWNEKYCTAPGRGIDGVTFRNIRYNGAMPYPSYIAGYDAINRVQNITFEGLKINGKQIYDDMPDKPKWYRTTDYVPAVVGNHVSNVVFKK